MAVLMQQELDVLKKQLLALSAEVEGRVKQAVQALLTGDRVLADKVKRGDAQIDNMEIELEEECLKVLALHQPVATDLRFIVSILKINNDLERVADFAVNIAERALDLSGAIKIDSPYDIAAMAEKVEKMLKMALDALVEKDTVLARRCIELDEEVDEMHKGNFDKVKDAIKHDPTFIDGLVYYLSISRYLERMGDLATNIAEDVVYQVDGEIIRHGGIQKD
ncbi:phosphate transport system protein [Malonomonas rubra DSM 5091]|uniref:Phosphate-specific transport system accessory protein PhoU n=1 Tax=Malonomonas rubra DSM 5091 TaxID=1122189 RepID=A0A1M6H6I1_MALRU|nr:phosphate signaling complex protein PhoU [Malonomonas rubra]SHJ17766.1 phosphate transport system protein [Malonomonas rubra DSM 5091]